MSNLESNIDTISEEVVHSLGYCRLKEEQRIDFVPVNNMFATLPTGFGKMQCFVYLPFVFDVSLGIESRFHSCGDRP